MPELPTGTVTFLFTDIEGSTSRWQQQGEAMQGVLARHDTLLRAAVELQQVSQLSRAPVGTYACYAAA